MYKILYFIFLSFGISHNGLSMDKLQTEDHILSKACIYEYNDDENDDTEIYCLRNDFSNKDQILDELSKIKPIHISVDNMEVGDSILQQLLPYSPFIYGLSLSNNFFTNKSLDDLKKFQELRYLDITNNSFLFPSLDPLETLSNLRHLKVTYNRIEKGQLEYLKNKLKEVEIIL